MMFWSVFVGLLVLALLIALFPLRKSLGRALPLMLVLLLAFAVPAYFQWGSWTAWRTHEQDQVKQQEAKAMLATISSPQELIDKLRAKLDDSPASARGWYLLGRLYGGQNQWEKARDAYAKSQQLKADDGAALGYIESLWQLNEQQFNDDIRQRLLAVLKHNPEQADALSMLAMDAYQRKDYQQATGYWRRLLPMVPAASEEGKALRKAIAKAQEQIENTP